MAAPVAQPVEHVLGKDGVTGSTPVGGFFRRKMREHILLECPVCKNRAYGSMKNKKKHTQRLEIKKFCRYCRKHELHKEVK